MFAEWSSLSATIVANSSGAQSQSVLAKFAGLTGREVAVVVVKPLAANLGPTALAEPSTLVKDEEVLWCMDVVCHGLSLPIVEHETIKDCVNVYCDWLSALLPVPNVTVPRPIVEDANMYARKIINHFHNLFVPRSGEAPDIIHRQVLLCHRVLRTLHKVALESQSLTRETWEALLLFLLAINEILLAPPLVREDVADKLCERVLSVLFEVWLLAAARCFPAPSLWKTLQESCSVLRHRIALIEQWNRVNLALTARLLAFTYGPQFPELKIGDEDQQLIPAAMSNDCVAQTWYRMLRTIGSPVALCSPQAISKTPQFMQWAVQQANGMEPAQQPCLLALPAIFVKAIRGVAGQVDAFLGIYQRPRSLEDSTTNVDFHLRPHNLQMPSHSSDPHRPALRHSTSSVASSGNASAPGGNPLAAGSGQGMTNTASGSASSLSLLGGGGGGGLSGSGVLGGLGGVEGPPHSPTPPLQRRLAKSFSVAPSSGQTKGLNKGSLIGLTSSRSASVHQPASTPNSGPSSTSSLTSFASLSTEVRPPLTPHRPKCNSILHLFGEWLFEAAHIGGDSWVQNTKKIATEASRRPSSMVMDSRKGSLSLSQPASLSGDSSVSSSSGIGGLQTAPGTSGTAVSAAASSAAVDANFSIGAGALSIEKFEAGRAEALGALCRIFCAKKTGEEILPVYLARFYMAVQQGLKVPESRQCEETMASILFNSADLFRLDLDGVQVLLPAFIGALELVLPDREAKKAAAGQAIQQQISMQRSELRRASIHLLLSMLALPLHFQALPIRDLGSTNAADKMITFIELKPRLVNILMNALQYEVDAQNTHMLLGGLLMVVQDAAAVEEFENGAGGLAGIGPDGGFHASPMPSDANLLSSACSERSVGSVASAGSSSCGGQSTVTLNVGGGGHGGGQVAPGDCASLSVSEDVPLELLGVPLDSAHALFVRATYLVCHRLISTWNADLNVSLAALELLSGLARMHIRDSARKLTDSLECKRAVKWICDYIFFQCQRPRQSHSKDLHSTIVAAFQCCAAWLMQHPYLLQDKDCLTTVLEVVELGISGSKSVGKPGEPVRLKEEKELKPASMRVRLAAETLFTLILEQVGYFPNECGPQSTSSLLDERTLYRYCGQSDAVGGAGGVGGLAGDERDEWAGQESAVQKFRYFVTENSTIMALLEEPLGNDQDPQPTVTLLIRGPFGRHAWTMQLRHLPRSKSGTKYHAANPGRPVPMNDMPMRTDAEQRHFPDGCERVPPCAADYSIPTLETIIATTGTAASKKLVDLIDRQTVLEKLAWAETESSEDSLGHAQESQPPAVCHDFQAARLFLSHFGFLSIGGDESAAGGGATGADGIDGAGGSAGAGSGGADAGATAPRLLTVLDTKKPGFAAELQRLDRLSPRTYDTLHVFYVRAGQTQAAEIVENMRTSGSGGEAAAQRRDGDATTGSGGAAADADVPVDPHFWAVLHGLGEVVNVHEHAGWTGSVATSWRIRSGPGEEEEEAADTQAADSEAADCAAMCLNGEHRCLYWADVGAEIAVVVPTERNWREEAAATAAAASTEGSCASLASASGDGASGPDADRFPTQYERSVSFVPAVRMPLGQKPRTLSLELDKGAKSAAAPNLNAGGSADPVVPPTRRRTVAAKGPAAACGARIMLVWLESYEDHLTLPIDDLLPYCRTGEEQWTAAQTRAADCHVIFVHALASGLLRVKLQGPAGRMSFATPLVDGMVVSRRVVGSLVRQTVYNMAKRRRLDNDLYQPPHVRRRIKVQDMVSRYSTPMTEPELLAHLFKRVD